MSRKAKIVRKTKETSITVEVNIDGKGLYKIDTKIHSINNKKSSARIDIPCYIPSYIYQSSPGAWMIGICRPLDRARGGRGRTNDDDVDRL